MADLWRLRRFHVVDLARAAKVPEETIYAMLSYKPVEVASAKKVLACLSAWYQQEYTLETVHVKLLTGETEWTSQTTA